MVFLEHFQFAMREWLIVEHVPSAQRPLGELMALLSPDIHFGNVRANGSRVFPC